MAEIVYFIDPKESEASEMLVIQLLEAKKQGSQFYFESPKPISSVLIHSLKEKELVQILISDAIKFI